MNWPWPPLRRGDIAAVVLLAAILAALLFGGMLPIQLHSNWGFGKDWHCTFAGKGDPVCIKVVSPRQPDKS